MTITKTNIDESDLIYQYLPVANYRESYSTEVEYIQSLTSTDLQVYFWTRMPGWIGVLFKLRNQLVKPFGLKGAEQGNDMQKFGEAIRSGSNYQMMSIPAKSDKETILCLTDKHLTMYFSVRIIALQGNKKQLKFSTIVQFHNKLGYLYFYTIAFFHYLIIRSKIKQIVKALESNEVKEPM